MEILLVLVALALVGGGIAVFVRGRNQQRVGAGERKAGLGAGSGGSARPAAPPRSDVRSLRVGDVVNHDGGDFVVEGTLRLSQGGFEWAEHRLVDGPRSLWLSVEDDEGLECVVWDRERGIDVEPGPKTLTVEGVSYELDERGKARYTAEGSTGTGASGRLEFVDYAAGEQRLAFERYGDEPDAGWEVGVGRVISEHMLEIYPGSGEGVTT